MKPVLGHLLGKHFGSFSLEVLLERGWAAVRAGDLVRADRTVAKLQAAKTQSSALSRLQIAIALARGDVNSAHAILICSLSLSKDADIRCDFGEAFVAEQRFEDAERSYRECLSRDSAHVRASIGLCRLLTTQGRQAEALAVITPITYLGAAQPEALTLASDVHCALGSFDTAILLLTPYLSRSECPDSVAVKLASCYEQSGRRPLAIKLAQDWLAQHPSAFTMHHLLGVLLGRAGSLAEAENVLLRLLDAEPRNAAATNDLGNIQRALGRHEDALESFQLAMHRDPALIDARVSLIAELDRAGHFGEARSECASLLLDAPHSADGWFWNGKLADRGDEIDRAAASYEKAAALAPGSAATWTNLGLVRLRLGDNRAAIECQRRALDISPRSATVHLNLGLALQSAGDISGAIERYKQSYQLDPNDDITLFHMAIAQLTIGDFERGWEGYEKRWVRETANARIPNPNVRLWNGESLEGKRLLIWGEQGLGDQIMFASCLQEISKKTLKCVVECDPRLVSLFARSFPDCRVVAGSSQCDLDAICSGEEFDFQSPIGSLPRFIRRSWAQFPIHNGYLTPNPALQRQWRAKLAALPGKVKVGLSWIGGVPITRQHLRSQPLAHWATFLKHPGIDFVSLQYTQCQEELAALERTLGVKVWHWQDMIDDIDQTAALVSQLDLIISVCTAVVHLAGALDVPTWVMTPATPEWRYLGTGERMPWYPSVHLVRQTQTGNWTDVIDTVKSRLAREVESKFSACDHSPSDNFRPPH